MTVPIEILFSEAREIRALRHENREWFTIKRLANLYGTSETTIFRVLAHDVHPESESHGYGIHICPHCNNRIA